MASVAGSHGLSRANPPRGDGTLYVLRADLELFEAPDGDLYLLGHEEDHVVAQPGAAERALLRTLSQAPLTRTEMLRRLAAQADQVTAADAVDALLDSELVTVCVQPGPALLPPTQAERYDRQLAYFTLTQPGAEHCRQQLLADATVIVIGVGGLGSWTAAALACVGVGRLTLVDDDRVELSNLNRQVLFCPGDVGKLKVEVAAAALRAFNPDLEIEARPERIRDPRSLGGLITNASLVVATADWPPYRISRWVNEACVDAGVPYISAGQVPPFIRVGPMVIPGVTACFECDERASRAGFAFYDTVVAQRERESTLAPTLGPASAMIGSMIGMEVLHHLTGSCRPATWGRAITVDMRSWQTSTRELERDEGCPVCGDS